MNYALLVYRCNGEYLYTVEEFKTSNEIEFRISELEDDTDNDFTYRVYGAPMTVRISPPQKSIVSVF